MNKEQKELEIVENFIYDEKVEKLLCSIQNSLMKFNIFEITGMGDQEIKHSNLIGWLFGDNEHGLRYEILEDFLKKVVEKPENKYYDEDTKSLKKFAYFSPKPKNILILREQDNIDLTLVDNNNKTVIVIENKVYAGEHGEQLQEYEKKVNNRYTGYKAYFIFLTIDGNKPLNGVKAWMIATHQMIGESVHEILTKKNNEFSEHTKLVLASYIDLLKRRNLMSDHNLDKLCVSIWQDPKYREALKLLYEKKPGIFEFKKKLLEKIKETFENVEIVSLTSNQSDVIICTQEWKNFYNFKEIPNADNIQNVPIRFGLYIVQSYIDIWVRQSENNEGVFDKIKNKLNKTKSRTQIDLYDYECEINRDELFDDEQIDDAVKKIIQKLELINECFKPLA